MTDPSGTSRGSGPDGAGHLDVEVLADLLAGEGTPGDVRHVQSCARCSGDLADLDAALVPVAAELAALAASPLPAPPPDLEERLRAALAAEPVPAATPAAPPGGPAARGEAGERPPGGSAVPPLAGRRRRPAGRPWLLSAAAAAAGLSVVGGLAAGPLRGGGVDSQAGSAGGGGAATSEAAGVPRASTGTTYRRADGSVARALPQLLAQAAVAGSAGDAAGPPAGPAPAASAAPGVQGPTRQERADDPLARLRDPDELAGCLAALTGPGAPPPLAVDYAAFEGRPALLVVLPSARPGKVDVYVVGAGCRAGDDQTLYFTRLDRPA